MHSRYFNLSTLLATLVFTCILGLHQNSQFIVQAMPTSQAYISENDCPRGPSFYDGCNWCYCSNARYLCTVQYCPDHGESNGFGYTGMRVFGLPHRGY